MSESLIEKNDRIRQYANTVEQYINGIELPNIDEEIENINSELYNLGSDAVGGVEHSDNISKKNQLEKIKTPLNDAVIALGKIKDGKIIDAKELASVLFYQGQSEVLNNFVDKFKDVLIEEGRFFALSHQFTNRQLLRTAEDKLKADDSMETVINNLSPDEAKAFMFQPKDRFNEGVSKILSDRGFVVDSKSVDDILNLLHIRSSGVKLEIIMSDEVFIAEHSEAANEPDFNHQPPRGGGGGR